MVRGAPRRTSRFVLLAARILRTQESTIVTWEHLILTSFVVTLLVHGLRTAGLLRGMETRWLDLMASVDRPEFRAPITVVAITDSDYHDPSLFGGMAPLHPDGLSRIVRRILAHRPRGVVIDVQIHPGYQETEERSRARIGLYTLLDSLAAAGDPPVVLVRDRQAERIERSAEDGAWPAWEKLTADERLFWADPTLVRRGGLVREVDCGASSEPSSVLCASIRAFDLHPSPAVRPTSSEGSHGAGGWRIRFTGHFLEDSTIVAAHRINARLLLAAPLIPGQRSLLTDRIILLGGTYYAGRDVQGTAVGPMAGVFVWAEAIASWIRHDALREPAPPVVFALEFLVGVLAGLLLVRFGPALGLLLGILLVAPLLIACSLLTFGSRVLFVNFLPSVVGVYLHYQIEVHVEIRRLKARVRELSRGDPVVAPTPTEPDRRLPEESRVPPANLP